MKKKRRKINFQKVFCTLSAGFILACTFFYGGRFIYLYLDNKKEIAIVDNTIGTKVKEANHNAEWFRNIDETYYFHGNVTNNYVEYSNMLFRIVKITENNEVVLISDKSLTSLAMGEESSYLDSYVFEWLNDDSVPNGGVLMNNLNSTETYLNTTSVCLDVVDKPSTDSCKKNNSDEYIGLLSLSDYVNTGEVNGFINNGQVFYLSDNNSDNEIWYVSTDGKISTSDGTDIYGVRPVITVKSSTNLLDGDGSLENPYIIETQKGMFGSYVKLGEDMWRVYLVEGNNVKLMLDRYVEVNDEDLLHKYSSKNYFHNDTASNSLANYLNKTFLNSLSYKDVILADYFSNHYYGASTDYDYKVVLEEKVDTKVSLVSIGNIILNSELEGYFTSTGNSKTGSMVYVTKNNGTVYLKNVNSKAYVVPVITISKDILVSGNGTLESPYGME